MQHHFLYFVVAMNTVNLLTLPICVQSVPLGHSILGRRSDPPQTQQKFAQLLIENETKDMPSN